MLKALSIDTTLKQQEDSAEDIYTVSQKRRHYTLVHIFAKY